MSKQFILTVRDHPMFGSVLVPCLAKREKQFLNQLTRIHSVNPDTLPEIVTEPEKEVIALALECGDAEIAASFKRMNETVQDFFNRVDASFIERHMIPFVEKRSSKIVMLCARHQIPVYPYDRNSSLYAEQFALAPQHPSEIIFQFTRTAEQIVYTQKILVEGREFPVTGQKIMVITREHCTFLCGNKVIYFSYPVNEKLLKPFFTNPKIEIPLRMEKPWFEKFLVRMTDRFTVETEGFQIIDRLTSPVLVLHLEENWKGMSVLRPVFRYGNLNVTHLSKKTSFSRLVSMAEGYGVERILRDKNKEGVMIQSLLKIGLPLLPDGELCPTAVQKLAENRMAARHALIEWLKEHEEQLQLYNIEVNQQFLSEPYHLKKFTFEEEVLVRPDWFDVMITIQFQGFTIHFTDLYNHIRNGNREYSLPDRSVFLIPETWFTRYSDLVTFGTVEGVYIRIKKHHAGLFSKKQGEADTNRFRFNPNPEDPDISAGVPASLKATLRDYQITGYQWMMALRQMGLNGCLADDMGLGKTVQVIALLCAVTPDQSKSSAPLTQVPNALPEAGAQLSLFDEPQPMPITAPSEHLTGGRTSLIIAPGTLLFNWRLELRRFAPHLRVVVYSGGSRKKLWPLLRDADIILTSYGLARIDAKVLQQYHYNYVILDESQMIRNPHSRTYKALLGYTSEHRLTLTGTPVENSLIDLYAQMNFLNRNMFGTLRLFREQFYTPMTQDRDPKLRKLARERLTRVTLPLMMRRTKAQVATELPPKTEQIVLCRMTPEQESLYETERAVIRNHIMEQIRDQSLKKSAPVIITALNRLRQIACHPGMVFPEHAGSGSGKLEQVTQKLRVLIDEGHKILVISSYVKHLRFVADWMEAQQMPYAELTGQTRNHQEVITRFKTDQSHRVMLLTLKKGGYGLNLTEADYVLILDPWWNPAAQQQGTDRVHRIGQEKPVFVYKFITAGTVEEKILHLQRIKKRIADSVVGINNPLHLLTRKHLEGLLSGGRR